MHVNDSVLSSDVSAAHMQLMLLVWYSFSVETRRELLTQCAQSVIAVAKANEYATSVLAQCIHVTHSN